MNTNSKYYHNYYFLLIFHGSWFLVYFLIWLMKHIIIITFCLLFMVLVYFVFNEAYNNYQFFVSYHCFCILVFCLVSPSFPIFCYKDNQAKVINSLLFFTKSFFSVKLFISKLNINQFRLVNPV